MAPLIYNVAPCHTLNSKISKVPLYKGLINYNYKFDKNRVSIVNCKKENALVIKNLIKSVLSDHMNEYEKGDYSETMQLPNASASILKPPSTLQSCTRFMEGILEMSRLQNFVPSMALVLLGGGRSVELLMKPGQTPNASGSIQAPNASGSILSNYQSCVRFIKGILAMSRLEDYLPSMALVLVGGLIAGGRSMEALMRPGQVWIVAGCSGLITVASMLINDIFDFHSGTDQANGRTSPLLSGQVQAYQVELVVGCLYGTCFMGLCFLEPMSLRLLIGVAAIATFIYTPILKQLTMVKNVVVAGIVSSSIFAGALATGRKEPLQNPVVAVALFLFLCILGREILMDVRDMVGDKAAGVNTLAVRFGGQIGTLTASFCLVVANALLISLLAVKAQVYATIGTIILLPLYAKMLSLCKEIGAQKESLIRKSIQQVVQQSVVHIGFGLFVLVSAI